MDAERGAAELLGGLDALASELDLDGLDAVLENAHTEAALEAALVAKPEALG